MFAGSVSNANRAISVGMAALLSFAALLPLAGVAYGAGIDGFDPNNLISDEAMYGDVADSLTVEEIQRVLADKGAACVKGQDGSPCLKNARFDTQSYPATAFCEREFVGGQGQSAAQVIANAAQACRVSPKVLIVLLQKEQGLVTSKNPTARNYARATGFACPDTAPCDPAKAGFATQVYAAASRLQQYKAEPHRFNFAVGRTSNIGYHPNKACGSTSVTPQNAATAALYNYTPYVPNTAALAKPYASGDACSSYGNRNFFRIHSDWFGKPNSQSAQAPTPSKPTPVPPDQTPPSSSPGSNSPAQPAPPESPEIPEMTVTAERFNLGAPSIVAVHEGINTAVAVGNWDGTLLKDVAAVDSNGDLVLYPRSNITTFAAHYRIGTGWKTMQIVLGGADFDGDRKDDIVAVDKAHNMYLYRGLANGSFGRANKIGTGWGIFESLLLLPQGPGGKPAIAGSGSGGSYLYTTNGGGGWNGRQPAQLPLLAGAITGPDVTGTGYSSIFVPESTRGIGVYTTSDGTSYEKTVTLTVAPGYSRLLALSGMTEANEHILDIIDLKGRVVAIPIRYTGASQPDAPAAPLMPQPVPEIYWSHVSFAGSKLAGSGWPLHRTYSLGDFSGDGHMDAAIVRSNGDLMLYPSYNHGTSFHRPQRIGTGWAAFLDLHTGVDFDGDTRPDIVARTRDGKLWLYPGNGTGGFMSRRLIGTGWNMFESIHVLRRGNNGAPVVYGASGSRIRQYPTNGRGIFQTAAAWQDGYPWIKNAISTDDWDNDGASDLLYRAADGGLFVATQRKNGFADPHERRIGTGWRGLGALVPAEMTGTHKALWVVSPESKLRTYQWIVKSPGSFVDPARSVGSFR